MARQESADDREIRNLRQENHRLRDRFSLLAQLSLQITSNLNPDAVLQDIVDSACNLTSAQYGALGIFDIGGHIQQFITYGVTQEERERIGDLPRGLGILGLLQHLQEPLRIANLSTHSRSVGFPANHPPMNTFLGVPIRYGDEALGNLYLTEKAEGDEFTSEDEALLTMFAGQAALAIKNAQRFVLERRARADAEAAQRALAESEQLHRAMMDNTTAVIYIKDAQGKYMTVNHRYETLFGVKEGDIIGKTDHDIHSKEIADELRANDMRVLEESVPLEMEETLPIYNNESHTYLSIKVPLYAAEGEPYAICGISTDITSRLEVEQLKADFLSMISHDLRNPLTTIKGLSSSILMEQGPRDSGTMLEYINTIDEESDRMAELVGNLLDMSRIEADSMPLDPEICHIADIAAECIGQVSRSRGGGRHTITTDISLELPEIYADYNQISRVLANLLSNAIKYSPEGTEILIKSYIDPNDKGTIVTEVKDEGVGIPEDEMDKIFDKFYRVTSRRGRGRPGSGLGLAICKAIIEAHDGKMWVNSIENKGSSFFFSLPAV